MYVIKNYMEELVFDSMKYVLKDIDICTCEKCMLDVAAIALNELKAKYVVTKKGSIYAKLNVLSKQFEVDVIAAITKASEIVKNNPRHEYPENKCLEV